MATEKILYAIISIFLIAFSGWSLSVHVCVLFGWSLSTLLLLTPFVVLLFATSFFFCYRGSSDSFEAEVSSNLFYEIAVIGLLFLVWVFLAYFITRPDLDDAFYTAIAAFASAHHQHSLLAGDPMFGENSLPLLFPSYQFSSFELLSGTIAYLFSVPAMQPYYVYLLPGWLLIALASNFLLTKELIPPRWLLAGVIAFLFTLLLGEMHRSPANFSFDRIFQGKAVFLSAIVPTIFYLTAKFLSKRGTSMDLFLLACCQMTSIGLSNFGMLMAPIVGFGALLSNVPFVIQKIKKSCFVFSTLLIPIPYLIFVMLHSKGTPLLNVPVESAKQVWLSVMGLHQQYFIGFLLLMGPLVAKNTLLRWRLAVPPFLFCFIYLNPYLSEFISKYVTTPAVYWRMAWSFPILIFSAVSCALIIEKVLEKKPPRPYHIFLVLVTLGLGLYSLPFNTLRKENIRGFEGFATWKVSQKILTIATDAIALTKNKGALLAPDEIAGVVSRFEKHPRLVNVRGMYLDILKPALGLEEYGKRYALYNLTLGSILNDKDFIKRSLMQLGVSVVVILLEKESPQITHILSSLGYDRQKIKFNYVFWVKNDEAEKKREVS